MEPLLAAAARCLMCFRADLTFRRVQSPGPAAVFGVVVHKHVVGDGEDVAVHVDRGRHHHLGTTKRKNVTNTKQSNVCAETSDLNENDTNCKSLHLERLSDVNSFFAFWDIPVMKF